MRIISFLYFFILSPSLFGADYILSFDDFPGRATHLSSPLERTKLIASQLPAKSVFFLTGKLSNSSHFPVQLEELRKKGHYLGNHTYDHFDIDRVSPEAFWNSVMMNEKILPDPSFMTKWFRYPYLNESKNPSYAWLTKLRLKNAGYRPYPVTVEVWDWKLNDLYLKENDLIENDMAMQYLRDLYIKMVLDSFDFYEAIRIKYQLPNYPHIILLHHNDLAALFIGDLLQALASKGHRAVDASEYIKQANPAFSYQSYTMYPLVFSQIKASIYDGKIPLWQDELQIEEAFSRVKTANSLKR